MAKDKLDEMRGKLKLDSLGETNKKELFNKFVSAGGQVVNLEKEKLLTEKKARRAVVVKRESEVHKEEAASVQRAAIARKTIDLDPANQKNNPVNLWIERFSAKLACVFNGVLKLSGEFKNSFCDLLLNDYQNSLLNSRMVLVSVLYQDKFVANEIKKRFLVDTIFPYYFELLFRFDNLYSEEIFMRLQVMKNQCQQDNREIREMLLQVFKPIFMLQPYYFSLKTGLERALFIEREIRKLETAAAGANLRKLTAAVDFTFTKFYPRLYSLIDYYYKQETQKKPMSFRDYIGINDEDNIGYLTNLWKVELSATIRQEEEAKKKLAEQAEGGNEETRMELAAGPALMGGDQDPAKRGLRIIEHNIDFQKVLDFYIEKKDPRGLFGVRDKVFLTYTLVDFFDKEFSFIFNSNKVEFNIVFLEGKRSDVKRELADIYYKVSNIFERVTEYLKIIRDIRKLDNDSFVSIQERSVRSNQYALQRSQVSRTVRKDAREFFEEFSKKFLTIISDYQREKKILTNPETILEFDRKISGERFASGKKVVEAIEDAYCFTSILSFLLMDGDLGGFSLAADKPIYLKFHNTEAAS